MAGTLMTILEARVKPERHRKDGKKYPRMVHEWGNTGIHDRGSAQPSPTSTASWPSPESANNALSHSYLLEWSSRTP